MFIVHKELYRVPGLILDAVSYTDATPHTGYEALYRIQGSIEDTRPYTGYKALYRIRGPIQDTRPYTGYEEGVSFMQLGLVTLYYFSKHMEPCA